MKHMVRTIVVVEAVLAVVGIVVSRWIGTPILEVTRVDLPSVVLALAATVPLVAVVFWGVRSESPFLAKLLQPFRKTLVPLFANSSRLELLLISIMAGVGEEVFFRGFLQASLGRVLDPWLALALVSALFGLAHYVSLAYAIVAAVLGAYMGAVFLWTGNLFVAIAVHALYDFAAILLISRMTLSPITESGSHRPR